MSPFETLFRKDPQVEQHSSVSFMAPNGVCERVRYAAELLGTSQSAVYRALVMDALPSLEIAIQKRRDAGELL